MNGRSDLSLDASRLESRNGSPSNHMRDANVLASGTSHDFDRTHSAEVPDMVFVHRPENSPSDELEPQIQATIIESDVIRAGKEDCAADAEDNTPTGDATGRLTSFWRRLKWGLILSIGRNDSLSHIKKEDMKAAVATQLEVSIMGSALVLTLCLQIQEVVGSRGGFAMKEFMTAKFFFVSSSALSFSLAFYAIITSAVMLLSINSVSQDSGEELLTALSSWSVIPRVCALTAAFFLGASALTAFFLGLENAMAWIGAAVVATAIVLTVASTIIIIVRVRRLQSTIWEETDVKADTERAVSVLDIENHGSPQRKFRDFSNPNLSSPMSQPILTPLSSLTNTTGFSIQSSRFRR